MNLTLREDQEKATELINEKFREGHRAVILAAPCGWGKTAWAGSAMERARQKGKKSAFCVDRIILCEQTSRRFDEYDIPHGVVQSGNARYRPDEPIQICSNQTLEARGFFPDLNVFIQDECHVKRKQAVEFINNFKSRSRVVGLSASPFTKGLADIYSAVVCPSTMAELIEDKRLAPLRVFVGKAADMKGAKKVAGEWAASEVTQRNKIIIGDVVSNWIKISNEVFGGPRKTIMFSPGVEDGADFARKFAEAGYNFVNLSYKDDDEFKRDAIKDFSSPDTTINGLIACDLLQRGFDEAGVEIMVDAHPYSKSFSSVVQSYGRGMRTNPGKEFCVLICHSGNYLRFEERWDDLYHNGVHSLEESTLADSVAKEITDKEKVDAICPKCGALWAKGADACGHCGFVKEKRSQIEIVPGEVIELKDRITHSKKDKQAYYSMLLWYCRNKGFNQGWIAHKFKARFGVWPRGMQEVELPMDAISLDLIQDEQRKYSIRRSYAGR
jgi:superfamily II DNA or RNA helicase